MEREFKWLTTAEVHVERAAPIDVTVQDVMTEMSSITSYKHSNPVNDKNRASRSSVNALSTSLSATSLSAQKNCHGHPKGSNYEKKQKEKENYLAYLSSICDDYATQMVAMRALNKKDESKYLGNLIEGKKAKFIITHDISNLQGNNQNPNLT